MTELPPIASQVPLPVLFQLMADRVPGVVWATDTALRFTASFGAGLAALGLRPSEVVGNTIFEYFRTDDEAAPTLAAHRRALQGETVESQLTWQDRVYRFRVEPLRDETGAVVGCIGFAQDITEQASADKELRTSEAKYRRLYQSMRDAFVSVDMSGRIVEFNDAYCQLLGYEPDELLKLTYIDLTPEEWHAFEAEIVEKQILRRRYSNTYEKEYRRRDGTVFPVELRTFLIIDDDGRPLSMWAIVRDITERKATEAALVRSREELERRVAERTAELATANRLLKAKIRERHQAERELRQERNALHLMLQAGDRDRELLTYEIHDGVAQRLLGALMQFEACEPGASF